MYIHVLLLLNILYFVLTPYLNDIIWNYEVIANIDRIHSTIKSQWSHH